MKQSVTYAVDNSEETQKKVAELKEELKNSEVEGFTDGYRRTTLRLCNCDEIQEFANAVKARKGTDVLSIEDLNGCIMKFKTDDGDIIEMKLI